MKIYLDVVMLENFIINTFLLYITLKFMQIDLVKSRIIISSTLGTIYTLVMIFPKLYFFCGIPFQVLVAFIMLKILLGKCDFFCVFKGTLIFLMLSLMLAGVCFKLSQIGEKYKFFSKNTVCDITASKIVISIIFVYLVISCIWHYIKDRFVVKNFIYDVEITMNQKKYIFRGFLDTGNSLVEPLTKLPCIIVENGCIENYFDGKSDFYNIPYTVVGSKGILKGYKNNSIRIKSSSGKWQNIQAMVCPCKQVLSNCNDYNALLSRGII